MRTLLCWLLLSTLVTAEEAWERSLRQILAEADGRQPVPSGTTHPGRRPGPSRRRPGHGRPQLTRMTR